MSDLKNKYIKEPQFHIVNDFLPEDHSLCWESIYCSRCNKSLHCLNEHMQHWIEAGSGNFCWCCFVLLFGEKIRAQDDLNELSVNQEIKSELRNEWIDVNDKMPEFIAYSGNMRWSQKVLCCVKGNILTVASRTNLRSPFDNISEKKEFWKDWENGIIIDSNNVTHWMPLPAPPVYKL